MVICRQTGVLGLVSIYLDCAVAELKWKYHVCIFHVVHNYQNASAYSNIAMIHLVHFLQFPGQIISLWLLYHDQFTLISTSKKEMCRDPGYFNIIVINISLTAAEKHKHSYMYFIIGAVY